MKHVKRLVAVLVVLNVVMLLLLMRSNRGTPEPAVEADSTMKMLPIEAANWIEAGQGASVTIGPADVADGTLVRLIADGSYGLQAFESSFENGMAEVELSAEFTQRAGHLTLFGSTNGYAGQTELTILAGEPVSAITPLVGPRSIIADGQAWTGVSVIPFDQFLNPVSNGTELIVDVQQPDGSAESYTIQTNHLIATQQISSTTTAGRSRVAVHSGAAFGPDATFEQTPAEPVAFEISADKNNIAADGHQLINLRSEILRDSNGNVLLDGVLVTFIVAESNGTRRSIPAYTLDGIAEITLQAPSLAGEATVQAIAAQTSSEPLTLTFITNAVRIPLDLQVGNDALTVVAGPILGTLGQFLPDGTAARFTVSNANFEGEAQTQLIENGYVSAEFRMDNLPEGAYTVTVLVGNSSGQANFNVSKATVRKP